MRVMPTINTIAVGLDGGREVYRPGEVVSGWWTLDLGEALTVRGFELVYRERLIHDGDRLMFGNRIELVMN